MADFQRHTEWNYQPQEIKKVSEGPVGVGSRFHTKEKLPKDLPFHFRLLMPVFTRVLGSKDYTAAEITAMEPGERFAWTSWQPLRGDKRALEVNWELRLEPQNETTRVTQRSHWVPIHGMSDPTMLEENIAKGVAENLNQLKQILER